MFCDTCGGILVPNKGKMYCASCKKFSSKRFVVSEKRGAKKKMLEESGFTDANPVVRKKCPKCGNAEAYFAFKQTRASDEAPTKFFRCTKCGKTWRQYD